MFDAAYLCVYILCPPIMFKSVGSLYLTNKEVVVCKGCITSNFITLQSINLKQSSVFDCFCTKGLRQITLPYVQANFSDDERTGRAKNVTVSATLT